MQIFHTYFAIFGQKIFFSKIRLHQSLGAVKSYLDTKNQKILMSRSSGISRTNWLTNGRTDEGKSIGPYLIGRSKKEMRLKICPNQKSLHGAQVYTQKQLFMWGFLNWSIFCLHFFFFWHSLILLQSWIFYTGA